MIEHNFELRGGFQTVLEFGSKKKKDKSKAQNWNRQNQGTSKAKLGFRKALDSYTGIQKVKRSS